jgi:hypothetical protein
MHQPTIFEPPWSALCHPSARGDGRIADDVHALGMLIVTVALGRIPLTGLDDHAMIHRQLELGVFEAVTARGRQAEAPADRPACGARLLELARPGDRIVVMGARDDTLTQFAAGLVQELSKNG